MNIQEIQKQTLLNQGMEPPVVLLLGHFPSQASSLCLAARRFCSENQTTELNTTTQSHRSNHQHPGAEVDLYSFDKQSCISDVNIWMLRTDCSAEQSLLSSDPLAVMMLNYVHNNEAFFFFFCTGGPWFPDCLFGGRPLVVFCACVLMFRVETPALLIIDLP